MTSAITTIPTETDVAVVPTGSSTTLLLFSVTPETIRRCDKYRELKVTDIHDEAQLKAVHDARMVMVGYRTTCKKEHKAAREDAIREQKRVLASEKALVAMIAEIEGPLEDEENRVQAAIEAERVAKKKALHDSRKEQMLDAVGEFTEILAMWPADLSDAGSAEFDAMLVMAGVHASGKRQLAEQQRIANEQVAKALAEQQERDRLAEVERVRQQAIEDANRKAAQAELDAKMALFEKRQAEAAELQRKADADREARIAQENADRLEREAVQRAEVQAKLDAQNAELERQRAEIETKRLAYEAEMTRLAQEADERVRLRQVEAERAEAARLADEAHERNQQAIRDAYARAAETQPDIEKMRSWVTAIENFADEQFPSVSQTCEDLLTELHRDLANVFSGMRERLT